MAGGADIYLFWYDGRSQEYALPAAEKRHTNAATPASYFYSKLSIYHIISYCLQKHLSSTVRVTFYSLNQLKIAWELFRETYANLCIVYITLTLDTFLNNGLHF